jgi:hypothetical protein
LNKIKNIVPAVAAPKVNFYHVFFINRTARAFPPIINDLIKPSWLFKFSSKIYLVIPLASKAAAVPDTTSYCAEKGNANSIYDLLT